MKDFEPKTKYYLPIYRLAYSVSENIQQAAICRDLAKSLDKAVVTSRLSSGPHIVLTQVSDLDFEVEFIV